MGTADYFAMLGESRRPYLDPEKVAEKFHELSRSQHPDSRAAADGEGDPTADFARLNQAQQTLRDPKLRLGYLIGLEYPEVRLAGPAEVPRTLAGLFSPIHALLEKVDAVLARKAGAPSALSRALLAREEWQLRAEVEAHVQALEQLYASALDELKDYDADWQSGASSGQQQQMVNFFQRFSYLSRWLDQLRERLFQLGS
jgi:curved DNA-binding protein CbpA